MPADDKKRVMNLHDLVKRKDRGLVVLSGSVECAHRSGPDGYMGIQLAAATRVRLRDAHQFACLRDRPRDIHWSADGGRYHLLSVKGDRTRPLRAGDSDDLVWPQDLEGPFDLEIVADDAPVLIRSSKWFNSRALLAHILKGSGVEVGPGNNPFVKPSDTCDVRYVESATKAEWMAHLRQG